MKRLSLALALSTILASASFAVAQQDPQEGGRPPREGSSLAKASRVIEVHAVKAVVGVKAAVGALVALGSGGPGFGGPPGQAGQALVVLQAVFSVPGDGCSGCRQERRISAEEINNAVAALKTLDKNNDGKLDATELRPNFEGMAAADSVGRVVDLAALVVPVVDLGPVVKVEDTGRRSGRNHRSDDENDKNGDGKLGKDELPNACRPC